MKIQKESKELENERKKYIYEDGKRENKRKEKKERRT